ncbi:MAG: hypothetical protein HOF44_01855 [Pelagibacterales bacterium]|jgi:hypothetical protein|nr:hypothetical protein [Pelagibacterales bacterium]|tara:strand:- start:28 stop:168 length:141 start_codon:yes stop_codon:yes gene_type:complete
MINNQIILFLEDLKSLLLETELSEEQNEVLIEAIDLIDEKIIELES